MVYFVGHVIRHRNTWIPLTNIPVHSINLGQDLSCRKLNPMSPSVQLLYQPRREMAPLVSTTVKTTYIKLFQKIQKSTFKTKKK